MALVAACAQQPQQGDLGITKEDSTVLPSLCDYPQAFGTAQHTGMPCTEVHGMRVIARITQDPDADAQNEQRGFLQIHESPPLTSGDYVVIPSRSGFTSLFDRTTDRYRIDVYRWLPSVVAPNAELVLAWSADTDWQPLDAVGGAFRWTAGYLQQFAPAIAGGSIYVPAAHGQVVRRDLQSGRTLATINPLVGTAFDGDPVTVVNNAISVDGAGRVYYTVVAFPTTQNISALPRGSWLVSVGQDNSFRRVDWESIASPTVGVPAVRDLCEYHFGTLGTPPATGPDSKAPLFACGTQRPALNAPIAISEDGRTLVAFSYANNAQGAAFLISIDAQTLTPIRAMDTRGHLHHGCGVRIPITSRDVPECAILTAGGTTNIGADPDFNGAIRWQGIDLMDSAPTIAPNGDVAIGSYDGGFQHGGDMDARGSGLVFTSEGKLRAVNETFWWEVTPSVLRHSDGTFSYLQDRQLYSDLELTVASYSPTMQLESAGSVPLDLNATSVDFVDAHIVFGASGDHYGVNGMGLLVKFDAGGHAVDSVELTNPDGSPRSMATLASYFARDRAGRIYASYAGYVYVVASSDRAEFPPTPPRPSPRLIAGDRAKRAAMAVAPLPLPPN